MHVDSSQEGSSNRYKARTAVRTTRHSEIIKERGSCKHFGRVRPRSGQYRHGLSSVRHEPHLADGLMLGRTSIQQSIHETTRRIDGSAEEINKTAKGMDENIRGVIVGQFSQTGLGVIETILLPGSYVPRAPREIRSCTQCRASGRSPRYVFAGNSGVCPRSYHAMGQRSSGKARLLVQRINRNGKTNDRTDVRRNGRERRDPWSELFLFSGLPRP